MASWILVHGAWLNANCWNKTIELLKEDGSYVATPHLPGHANNVPDPSVTLKSYVDAILSEIKKAPEPVHLVGHSMAGIVISQVAEEDPDSVAKLIYIAAYLPQNGESLTTLAQQDKDSQAGPAMRPTEDWSLLDIEPSARRDIFYHDVEEAASEKFLQEWKAEPTGPMNTPVTLTPERFGKVSKAYIQTTLDRTVSPYLQHQMLSKTPCDPVVTIETGHTPMLSRPKELATLLRKVSL